MTSSDDVKKANKIPYETVEDQIALLDKKKLKQDLFGIQYINKKSI